jgi:replication factor A1
VSQDISLEEVIRTIVSQTGLSREEIRKKIDATIASFDGLLTEVGAALIIGDKLGVKVNAHQPDPGSQGDASGMDSALKIKDLIEGTRKNETKSLRSIVVFGRVVNITPPHEFQKKDGRKGAVASITLKDATGQVRVSCWDQRANLVDASIKQGAIIGVFNAYTKIGREGEVEVHVDNKGMLKPKPDNLDESAFPAAEPASNGGSIKSVAESGSIKSVAESGSIKSVTEGATFTSFTAKVVEKLPPKAFTKKDGSEGSVARVKVADVSTSSFVVFWADRMEDYNGLNAGEVYQFESLAVRKNTFGNTTTIEFHVSQSTKIAKSVKKIEINVKKLKIGDITETQSPISFEGRVSAIDEERQINLKDGTQTRNIKLMVADETGSINLVAWRETVDEVKKFKPNDPIKVENVTAAMSRFSNQLEAKLGKDTKITKPQKSLVPAIETVPADKAFSRSTSAIPTGPVQRLSLDHVEDNAFGEVVARVINVSRYINNYIACPKCKKKVTLIDGVFTCVNDGKQPRASPRLIAKLTVDDGVGKINVTMIGDSVVKFFSISDQEKAKLAEKEEIKGSRTGKDEILARVNDRILLKSYVFRGRVKFSEYQKEFEIIADSATEVDLNKETAMIVKEIESAS